MGLAAAAEEAVVIVADPYWDDVDFYAYEIPALKGKKVVKVMTRLGKSLTFNHPKVPVELYKTFIYDSEDPNASAAATDFCPLLKNLDIPVVAVVPTSDPTVDLADKLAACTGVRGNPAYGPLAQARRDKWVMMEAVRKAGLRSIQETKVSTWAEAEKYLKTWDPPLSPKRPCVFKVLTGAGSEGIESATSLEQAKEQFFSVIGTKSTMGGSYAQVLVQEFLKGKQYAVDTVSRDGIHKVVTVWREDFRPANGAFNDYFGFKVLDPEDALSKMLIDYSSKVLDATGLYNGAANLEAVFLEDEQTPCLMEVNARWAGLGWTDGYAVEEKCVGTNQISATFDAFLDPVAFEQMPAVRPIKEHGGLVFGVNYVSGILKGIPAVAAAEKCASYYSTSILCTVGKPLSKTTNGDAPIIITLIHKEKAKVDADYTNLIKLEQTDNGFFDIEPTADSAIITATRVDSSSSLFVTVVVAGFLLGASAVGIRRSREARDGTEYVAVA